MAAEDDAATKVDAPQAHRGSVAPPEVDGADTGRTDRDLEDDDPTTYDMRADHTDPDLPVLVSFPRSGSQWLGAVMELYFGRPCLRDRKATLLDAQRDDYLFRHEHDLNLDFSASSVIYLYRDPIETIFSQVKFHEDDPFNDGQVELWSTFYRLHLRRWLLDDTLDRTVVRYEDMKADVVRAMTLVLSALGQPVDVERIARVADETSRDRVAKQTAHDPRVVNTQQDYADQRTRFAKHYSNMIHDLVIDQGRLHDYFRRPATISQAA